MPDKGVNERPAMEPAADPGQKDSGLYVIWLQVESACRVRIGALGELDFRPGLYAYVGTAQRGRSARVARHLRVNKPLRWHFDYLRPHGHVIAVSYASGSRAGECSLARGVVRTARAEVAYPHFGASDCRCPGHLLYMGVPPDFAEMDRQLQMVTKGV